MPDYNDLDLNEAINTIKGLHDGSIDPETITLNDDEVQEDNQNPPADDTKKDDQPEVEEEDSSNPDDEGEEVEEEQQEEEKKVQTPEENRKFAEQRRQQELEKRVQEELNKRMQDSPEMQVVKMLSDHFGVSPQDMLAQIQLGQLQEQNPEVPVDILQQRLQSDAQNQALQAQIAQLQEQMWQNNIRLEGEKLKQEYSILTDDDLAATYDYMQNTLGNLDIPLKQAVMAVHGEKIMESLRTQARNEVLAEKSGRKSPLTPQGGKSPSTPTLTDDERQIAKLMGVSEEDYLKYK